MEILILSVTVLVSFLGGMVILARSGARYGRTMAAGLIFLSLMEVFYLVFFITRHLAFLNIASFFELSCTSAILLSVSSMETSMAKNTVLVKGERTLIFLACLLYAVLVALFPDAVFSRYENDEIHLGWVMSIQSFGVLTGAVAFIWIMENIIRAGNEAQKRVLKYPALGILVLGVAFVLTAVRRMSTLTMGEDVLILDSLVFLVGISFIIFFSIRFKLFEMDVFVSRYVVYHSATFLIIGAYLMGMGLIILGVQHLGIHLSFVAMGFMVFLVLLVLAFLLMSKEVKARLRFFINTHFFANKYDYRKEWGELSGYLSIAYNEKQIIHVTAQVIFDSMYISELGIWIRNGNAFHCAYGIPVALMSEQIAEDEPFIEYLEKSPFFLRKTSRTPGDTLWGLISQRSQAFLGKYRIELAVPMMVENRLIGFIAVGAENPGTPYGQDDIDLLTAISSQSCAALMSARFAQELASNKEVDAFNRMSSYVLHDLKNAAGNLSLILQNAPNHMDNEEFRGDMLETISQTLSRIDKVMTRLGALPEKGERATGTTQLSGLVEGLLEKLSPRLKEIEVEKSVDKGLVLAADPDMLERALENLLINAAEAVRDKGWISITAAHDGGRINVTIEDNGIGMTEEFLRDRLFKPFQTTKKKGTGIGLWQGKNLGDGVGGAIRGRGSLTEGTSFTPPVPA
jgi:putative PEP-CTERM system histidine kinase